ncbi:MAG: autorepressor SdpR family transcription factor [Candidatus Cloacimonadales bacterium]
MLINDRVFKALADKNRRKIIRLLKKSELNAGEIAQHFQISKPSISEHLKILRNAELIDSERDGQYVRYFLNSTVLEGVISNLLDLLGKDENQEDEDE